MDKATWKRSFEKFIHILRNRGEGLVFMCNVDDVVEQGDAIAQYVVNTLNPSQTSIVKIYQKSLLFHDKEQLAALTSSRRASFHVTCLRSSCRNFAHSNKLG